jgi:hypothetical protein
MHLSLPAAEKEQVSNGLDLGYQLLRLAMGYETHTANCESKRGLHVAEQQTVLPFYWNMFICKLCGTPEPVKLSNSWLSLQTS